MSRSEQIRPGTPDRSMERWGPANWTIVVQECSGRKKGLNCVKKYCNFRCFFSLLRHSLISEVFDIVAVSVLIVVNYCKPFSTLTHWFVCNFWKTLTQFCPKKIRWYSHVSKPEKRLFLKMDVKTFFPPRVLRETVCGWTVMTLHNKSAGKETSMCGWVFFFSPVCHSSAD